MTRSDGRRLAVLVALLAVLPLCSPLAAAGVGTAADAGTVAGAETTADAGTTVGPDAVTIAGDGAAWDGVIVGEVEPGGYTETTVTFEPQDERWDVSDVYVTGPDGSLFSVVSGGGSFSLAQGEARNLTIGFEGDDLGVKNATLVIEEEDATIETPLSGEVVEEGGDGATLANASFGEVSIGETATRTVSVPSPVDRDATVEASLIGSDADRYRIIDGGGTVTIPDGEDHEITVAFSPASEGPATARIELVPENDTIDPGYVDLTGTGVGDGTDDGTNDGDVTLETTTVDFRDVPIDRLGARYVDVENDGNESVTLSLSSTVDGPGTVFLNEDEVTVPANGSKPVPIVFAPEERADSTGTVTLDGPALSDPLTVSVSGGGAPPRDPGSTIGVLSRNVTLWAGTVADDVAEIPFFVRNNGSEPIDLSVDGLAAPFSTADASVTLDPGEIRGLPVRYDPTTEETVTDTLVLSRSTGESVEVSFTGVVEGGEGDATAPPNVSLSTAAIDFGAVPVGEEATRTLTVTNEGEDPIDVAAGEVGTPFGVDGESVEVAPGESRTLTVGFAPGAAGGVTDSLTVVAGNTAGTVERTVDLSGTGVDPRIDVTVADDSLTADDPTTTVTIANPGEGELTVTELTLPGPFSLDADAPLTVPAGESVTLDVAFDASVDANVTSTLRIASDDADDPIVRRSLRGIVESSNATVGVDGRVSDDEQRVNATVTDVEDGSTVSVDTSTGTAASERVGLEEIAIGVDEGEPFTLNVTTADRKLSSSPTFDRADNTSDVGYLSVDHSVPDENVEAVSFTFTVPDSRVPTNATTGEPEPGDMALYRYVDDEWVELDTEPVRELDGGWEFRAVSPGLSEFAVGRKEPQFEIDRAEINVTTAEIGDGIAIRVLITNTGGADGIYDVNLFENGERVDRRQPTVPPNATVRIVFLRAYEEAGQYRIDVNDRTVDTVAVEETATPTPNGTETPTPTTARPTTAGEDAAAGPVGSNDEDGGGGLPVVPLLAAGIVVTAAVGVAYRRFGGGPSADGPPGGDGNADGGDAAAAGAVEAPADDRDWSEWSDWEEETGAETEGSGADTEADDSGTAAASDAPASAGDAGEGGVESDPETHARGGPESGGDPESDGDPEDA